MEFLTQYLSVVIVIICSAVGYIIKNFLPDNLNNFIPLFSGVLGIFIACWTVETFTPEVLATGLVSGLAATGCYELVKKLIDQFGKDKS